MKQGNEFFNEIKSHFEVEMEDAISEEEDNEQDDNEGFVCSKVASR
jgi:hypothetical protein